MILKHNFYRPEIFINSFLNSLFLVKNVLKVVLKDKQCQKSSELLENGFFRERWQCQKSLDQVERSFSLSADKRAIK